MPKFKIEDLQKQVIAPGIYFNMPDEVYHADRSISNSGMGHCQHTPYRGLTVPTPKNYWAISNLNPDKEPVDSVAMKMGRALHLMVLEPEKFNDQFEIKPKVKTTTVAGMIGEGQYKKLSLAAKAVAKHPTGSALIAETMPEVAMFWIDEATGVPCRVKIDALGLLVATDLKGTRNVYEANDTTVKFGYHRQAGFYLSGIAAVKKLLKAGTAIIKDCPNDGWLDAFKDTKHKNFVLLLQEKEVPFNTRAVQMPKSAEENGLARARECLEIFKRNYEAFGESEWSDELPEGVETLEYDELNSSINY